MNARDILVVLLASVAPFLARGEDAPKIPSGTPVALLSSSLGEPKALARLIAGRGEWRAEGGQFAKIDMRFVEPTPISRVELESCRSSFADGVDVIVNFDHTRMFAEGGKQKLTFSLAPDDRPLQVKALVLNFRYNRDVCVREMRLLNGVMRLVLRPPGARAVEGAVPSALFDSRLETIWVAGNAEPVEIKFASETEISRVRVWNGDPRGTSMFKASPRVKTLTLATDKRTESVSLEDSKEPQTASLKSPLRGKVIRVSVAEAHGGSVVNAALAELQFGGTDGFSAPDVTAALKATAESRKAGFRTSGLGEAVDHALGFEDEGKNWSLRLRSDGSVFIKGHSENLEHARAFSFLGLYTIVEATTKRLRLKLSGTRFTTPAELDSSVCAADCAGGAGHAGQWIDDEISFGRAKDGMIFVRDEGPRRPSGLDFHDFKARILKSGE